MFRHDGETLHQQVIQEITGRFHAEMQEPFDQQLLPPVSQKSRERALLLRL